MEQKSKNNSKKAALIATVVILVGALLVAGCLLLTAKSRIVGVWTGGPVYLEYYSSYCYMTLSFGEDGDYARVLTDSSGNTVNIKTDIWEMSNFEISAAGTSWDYNPITNKVTNGDWTLKKVSESFS